MLFDDEHPEAARGERRSVVAPAKVSAAARRKALTKRTPDGDPVHSLHTLLDDLATISQNTVKPNIKESTTVKMITRPTPLQSKALKLLGVRLKCSQ